MTCQINEKDLLHYFYQLVAEVECGSYFDFNNPQHERWLRNRISRHFSKGTQFYGYFLEDQSPIGFASLLMDEHLENVEIFGQTAELLHIGVYQEFRGKGYGKELLDYTEEVSRENGAYCMYATTYAKDYHAIAFYGRNGFVPVATLPDVNGPGNEGNVCMRKILRR